MEQDNKIQIEIYGVKFVINSTEPKEYVKKIAKEIDKNIRDFMKTHSNSSVGDAYLISLLSYADRLEKEKNYIGALCDCAGGRFPAGDPPIAGAARCQEYPCFAVLEAGEGTDESGEMH